jgi:hypothetical protein
MTYRHRIITSVGSRFSAAPVSGETDPFFANVVLLAGFNGPDDAQSYTAETGQVLEITGSTVLDNTQVKYGTTSHKVFAGVISVFPSSSDWTLHPTDADEFCMEWYQYLPTLTTTDVPLQCGWNITGFMVRSNITTMEYFWMDQSTVSRSIVKPNAGFTANQWDEICIEKNSSRLLRFYINGTMVHSETMTAGQGGMTDTTSAGGWPLRIGLTDSGGWLDELRITKGVTRYNSDGGYAPHTAPFPRS